MSQVARRRSQVLAIVCVCLATAYCVIVTTVHVDRAPRVTSYLGTSPAVALVALTTAYALVGAGAYVLWRSRSGWLGTACLVLACTWLGPVLVGWDGGPSLARALAAMIPALAVPVLAHLALTAVYGTTPWVVAGAAVGYVLVGLLSAAAGLVRHPLLDAACWSDCSDYVMVTSNPGLSADLTQLLRGLTVVVAAVVLVLVVVQMTRAHAWPALAVAAALTLLAEAANALRLQRAPLERFDTTAGLSVFLLQAAGLLGVAGGAAWLTHSRRQALRRATRLMSELAERRQGGSLQQSLRAAVGDPTLTLRYWRRDTGQWVDADGRIRPEGPGAPTVARVVRGREPVALIEYDGHRLGRRVLEQELGAVARLAIDTERLRAESLGHLAELTLSRERIVAEADSHRRRVERDLHDGAQQRLLAVTYELRLARAEADDDVTEPLDEAIACARTCLDELREFAHGVFPAVLDHAGLEEALWSLAERSDPPMVLHSALASGPRFPAAERTAYFVARSVVQDARGTVTIDVRRRGADLVLVAAGVGTLDEVHLRDRVGAVGGELRHDGDRLEAVIPCG
ncbi:hypothetical protein CFI00_13580 [Nocardioides sp. S5]|uniref:histidine kinase n=1 Tax=Nocardioides sp. S5 TaxID=2017486 RepID=UPI001A8F56D6|nr:histidine kinase [Nocardioides sp. S5]QSR31515.1 hypothetical protein CFI00_13580 [Nocardioides sp. S5]